MKIVRFLNDHSQEQYGCQQADGSVTVAEGELLEGLTDTGKPAIVQKLLAPIAPTDILCIGLNYKFHADEGGLPVPKQPVLFMKASSCVQNPGDPILVPTRLKSEAVDYECELVVVIGKLCKNATKDNALDYVLGYTCGNDVSARDWQLTHGGGQWCRGKTFATFAPIGPCIVTPDELGDPNAVQIKTILNGEVMQDWNTNDMIFNVPNLIEFLSGSTTLLPGTVIFTGTPHGIGFARNPQVLLKHGDTVTVQIEKIGELTNPVRDERWP
jgi:2-keto-4-pentenoate hydratase/2-oxohepta-3-ene-1,7-dioic acid hydratase in catechol pathway